MKPTWSELIQGLRDERDLLKIRVEAIERSLNALNDLGPTVIEPKRSHQKDGPRIRAKRHHAVCPQCNRGFLARKSQRCCSRICTNRYYYQHVVKKLHQNPYRDPEQCRRAGRKGGLERQRRLREQKAAEAHAAARGVTLLPGDPLTAEARR